MTASAALRVAVSPMDTPFGREGSKGSEGSEGSEGVVSPWGDEYYNSASRNGKPYNRASPDENAPLFPYGDFHLKVKRLTTFCASLRSYKMCSLCTPEGEVLAAHYLELLMSSTAEQRVKFSLRGERWCVSTKRGAFPAPARAVVWF